MNNTEKKPKYAMRKLSIGLVSCMLGFTLMSIPSQSFAAEGVEDESTQVEEKNLETDSETTNDIENNESQNEADSDIEFGDNIKSEPVQAQAQEYTHKIMWGKDTGKPSNYNKYYDKGIDGEKIQARVGLNLYAEDDQGKRVNLFAGYGEEELEVGKDKIINYSNYKFYKLTDTGYEPVSKDDYKILGVEGLEWPVSDETNNKMWTTYSGYNVGYTALYQNINSHIEYKKVPDSLILEKDKNDLEIKYNIKNKKDGKLVQNGSREVIVEENDKFKDGEKKWLSDIGDPWKKKPDDREKSINFAIEQGYLEMYSPYTGKYKSYDLVGEFKKDQHKKYYNLKIEGSDTKGWTVTLGSNLKEKEDIKNRTTQKFITEEIYDDTLDEGYRKIEQEGHDEIVKETYKLIYLPGKNGTADEEVERTLKSSEKIQNLVQQIIRIGTRKKSNPSGPIIRPGDNTIPSNPSIDTPDEDDDEYRKLIEELIKEIKKETEKQDQVESPSDEKKQNPSKVENKTETPSETKKESTNPQRDAKKDQANPYRNKKADQRANKSASPKTGVTGSLAVVALGLSSFVASLGLRKKYD